MNIKITHTWLLEYLETDAAPAEIRKYLSLSGPSVESVTKVTGDFVYDIEVTSNRIDMASVIGIAREASAILPRFGKKAKLIKKTFKLPTLSENNFRLAIEDENKLTNRVLAVIIDGVQIGPSPQYIKQRLELAGIRSLNNLVDITNYVMLEIGHPTHVFDYDRIKTRTFVFRKAQKDEELITLDGKKYDLEGNEVVIDDGTGRIVDLPSIMGTENSVVTRSTKRIIFFIDNINPQLIRQASMTHGIRSLAASYNEKSPDSELGYNALLRGIELLEKTASAKSISKIIDLYPRPDKAKTISLSIEDIQRIIGVPVKLNQVIEILTSLGFHYRSDHGIAKMLLFDVPSYRSSDVSVKEDLIEEVARIYGYHNLPNNIQPTVYVRQPTDIELLFELQAKIKHFLKDLGLHEVMNYSMVSKDLIDKADLKIADHLELKNTFSEEIRYMRTHLLPSLIMNIKNNEGKAEVLKFFEIAKTYIKIPNDLPNESYKLGIVVNTSLEDLKGIIDSLLDELNITNLTYMTNSTKGDYRSLQPHTQAQINIGSDYLVKYGQIAKKRQIRYELKSNVFVAIFNLTNLMEYAKPLGMYHAINPYALIKLDHTLVQSPHWPYAKIKENAFKTSPLLQKIELIDTFKNKITLRLYFAAGDRNITEEEAKKELEKIVMGLG